MKIVITGHSKGIGAALAKQYELLGHEIIGLSRSNGHNIHNTIKCANIIEPCDMLINNAQAGFAQTNLLLEMHRRWVGQSKIIMNISTEMTSFPVSVIDNLNQYFLEKNLLEQTIKQLRYKKMKPRLILVKPGDIATEPHKTVPPSADVDHWAKTLVEIFDLVKPNLAINEISLGPLYK